MRAICRAAAHAMDTPRSEPTIADSPRQSVAVRVNSAVREALTTVSQRGL
jgi:uncharacterized protein (DUF4415 family)